VSCAYQSADAEYVRRHAGGGENRAQPQEREGFRHTGQNRPTPDPGTGARLVALGGECSAGWRAKRGFNPESRECESRERTTVGERGTDARERNRGSGEAEDTSVEGGRARRVWEGKLWGERRGWRSSGGASSGGRRREGSGGGGGGGGGGGSDGGEHKIPRTCLVHSLGGMCPCSVQRRPASTPPSLAFSVPPLASVALRGQLGAHATPLVLPGGLARALFLAAPFRPVLVDVRCIVARAPATLCHPATLRLAYDGLCRVSASQRPVIRVVSQFPITNRARERRAMADAS